MDDIYRAYNKKTKEMEYVLLICFVNKYVDVLPERNLEGGMQESWKFDEIELMKNTGLKDIHNNEIFKGDIVKRMSDFSSSPEIGEIIFLESIFLFKRKLKHYEKNNAIFNLDIREIYDVGNISSIGNITYEIIGNIYQNPELLKDK